MSDSPLPSKEMVDPWPCHRKPKKDWCDREGRGGFMGHTCVPPQKPTPMLFLDWFLEQYDVGLWNEASVREAQAYLQGLRHCATDDEMKGRLGMIENMLRSAEVMARVLKQYEVRMPHG